MYVIIMSSTRFRVNPHSIVCLNVKELLARSRRHIWILSDSNDIRTHDHLGRKRTLNPWAKWLSVCLRTKWLWVRISLLSLENIHVFEVLIFWRCRGFEIFLIDHCASKIGNKNINCKSFKNSCNSVTHPILGGSFHTGCYVYNSWVHIPYFLGSFSVFPLISAPGPH